MKDITSNIANMKLILTVLLIAQIHGALSINTPLAEQRGLMDIWDFISPVAIPVAGGIDNAIASVSNAIATVSSAHAAVTNAITEAIGGVTSWIGGKLPPLGKRDLQTDARVTLLNELKAFQVGLQQSILEIVQVVVQGKLVSQFRPLLAKLTAFLQSHLSTINQLITNLIPSMQDATATQAITSCLHAVQVIGEAIKKIQALFSS